MYWLCTEHLSRSKILFPKHKYARKNTLDNILHSKQHRFYIDYWLQHNKSHTNSNNTRPNTLNSKHIPANKVYVCPIIIAIHYHSYDSQHVPIGFFLLPLQEAIPIICRLKRFILSMDTNCTRARNDTWLWQTLDDNGTKSALIHDLTYRLV